MDRCPSARNYALSVLFAIVCAATAAWLVVTVLASFVDSDGREAVQKARERIEQFDQMIAKMLATEEEDDPATRNHPERVQRRKEKVGWAPAQKRYDGRNYLCHENGAVCGDSEDADHHESAPCRLIFSANPGRSGSGYLSRILAMDARVDAGNERVPSLMGNILKTVKARGLEENRVMRRDIKIPHIDGVVKRGWKYYAETSHGFLKTLQDIVMEEYGGYCLIDVIVLRRDMVATACSLWNLNWTRIHDDWLVEHFSRIATLPLVPVPNLENDWQVTEAHAILWYLFDTAAKADALCAKYERDFQHRFRCHYAWLEQLQTEAGVDALLSQLDLKRTPSTQHLHEGVIGYPYNELSSMRRRHPNRVRDKCSRPWMRSQIEAFVAAAQRANITLPDHCIEPPPPPPSASLLAGPPDELGRQAKGLGSGWREWLRMYGW